MSTRRDGPVVCVVGEAGREHALAVALKESAAEVIVAPGNSGIAAFPGAEGIRVSSISPEALEADLFVIGPEANLVRGLADELRAAGKLVLGPGAEGARLEGSKVWMKSILDRANVPTARWRSFSDPIQAKAFLSSLKPPYVIKTDGLAAGKGVLVTNALEEAESDVEAKLAGRAFGEAGRVVVIEEAMAGPEVSLLALCDGRKAVPLPPARDAKRLQDGDRGPNTGGMGAFSPVPDVTAAVQEEIVERCIEPTLAALQREGIDYRGVLYAGCMLTEEGPKVVEFNVRFGDPEAQVVLPRLGGDLTGLLMEAAQGDLRSFAQVRPEAAVCVVLASEGYPVRSRRNQPMVAPKPFPGVTILQAGSRMDEEGNLLTNGGRVLDVVATGSDLAQARERAYEAVAAHAWPGAQWRNDIAGHAVSGGGG